MEAVRRYVDSDSLMSVLSLPEKYRNRQLEVIVIPVEEIKLSKKEIVDNAIKELIGSVPYTDMTLEEIRAERLKKYEITD